MSSLIHASQALDASRGVGATRSSDGFLYLTETLYNLKSARAEFDRAADKVCGYVLSKDEVIHSTADATTNVFVALAEDESRLVAFTKDIIDHPEHMHSGDFADELSSARVQIDQAWNLFMTSAMPLASYALAQMPERADDRLSQLRLTASQRSQLLQRLEGGFGLELKSGAHEGQTLSLRPRPCCINFSRSKNGRVRQNHRAVGWKPAITRLDRPGEGIPRSPRASGGVRAQSL